MNKKWLIAVDLDGTLLEDRDIDGNHDWTSFDVPTENLTTLKRLDKLGHKVVIITGRPWRDTKEIYDKLKISTIVANYNGAYVHNPDDEKFMTVESAMNRILIEEMIDTTSLKDSFVNIIIEYKEFSHVLEIDASVMEQIHIPLDKNILHYKIGGKLLEDPFSVIFKIDVKKTDIYDLLTELKRKYGDTFIFRYWDDKAIDFVILEINQKAVTKATAMNYIARYYNIDPSRTIAFGDGMNDITMLAAANMGIAMKNSRGMVKNYAKDVTDYVNYNSGVAKYLKDFFKEDLKTDSSNKS